MAKFTRRPKNYREARQLEFKDSDPSGEELQPRVSEVTNDTFLRARRTNHNQNWIKAIGMEITDWNASFTVEANRK